MRKVARITQEQAVRARRGGENVVADRRQAASQIETAANGAEGQLKHAGHELKDGSKGLPHYQTEGTQGHTFWGKLSVATVAVADALDQVAEAADRIDPVAVMTNIPEAGQPGVVHECANGCSNLPQDSDPAQEERQSELPPSPNED